MYDHLGGGFHRYSTDGHWLVPHFEKMLYDNAQLARCYLHAWQYLGKPRYRTVVQQTLDYLLREMQHPRGGFFSAQDADTVEGEGAYFTWTPGRGAGQRWTSRKRRPFERTYGLTARGNFEGRNILHLPAGFPTPAHPEPASGDLLRPRPGEAARRPRDPPQTRPRRQDTGRLERPGHRRPGGRRRGLRLARLPGGGARGPGSSSWSEMAGGPARGRRRGAGPRPAAPRSAAGAGLRLLHSWKDGRTSGDAFLDDHACVAEGFLALYRCTFDERWFVAARDLVDGLLERFARPGGGFYDTSGDHETLITRPRAAYDSPTPTGTSMAATVLLKMAAYTGEARYRERAEEALASLAGVAAAAPVMSGQWLTAALLALEEPVEVAIVGDLDGSRRRGARGRGAAGVPAPGGARGQASRRTHGRPDPPRPGTRSGHPRGGLGLPPLHLLGPHRRPGGARGAARRRPPGVLGQKKGAGRPAPHVLYESDRTSSGNRHRRSRRHRHSRRHRRRRNRRHRRSHRANRPRRRSRACAPARGRCPR